MRTYFIKASSLIADCYDKIVGFLQNVEIQFHSFLPNETSAIKYLKKRSGMDIRVSGARIIMVLSFLVVIFGNASRVLSQTPIITTRFANPSYSCSGQYCLDVEFLSNLPDVEIFGMNIRFFYPDSALSLIGFSDFQGGYGPIPPNPPDIITSESAGPAFFNFPSAADFVNGAMQLLDTNIILNLDTAVWTKLFQVCFQIIDPNLDEQNFCVPVIWDMEQDPANGGFLNGDDGVVITVVDPDPFIGSSQADVNVSQFNWTYTGSGTPPYGEPTDNDCIPLFFDASINGNTSNLCYYGNRTFHPIQPEVPGAIYQWTFGSHAIPSTATGYGPHTVYYDSTGSKIVKLVIHPNGEGPQCPDSSTLSFTVIECPANIAGSVKNVNGQGIQSVNVQLYKDDNLDGLPDNSNWIKSVNTLVNGNFSMLTIIPGNYVIVEIQPTNWISVNDRDVSPDGDIVANTDSLDNMIPATLTPNKVDIGNNFVERPEPGNITGFVFIDYDLNNNPGSYEGLVGDTLRIYHDNDKDGLPDNNTPIAWQITNANGFYSFLDVPPANYVIVETQMEGYLSIIDRDASNDLDSVANVNMHDDIIPVTVTNGENDDQNYFVEADENKLLVKNCYDVGPGSLRQCIQNAVAGDTIIFDSSLTGLTITITSSRLNVNKTISVLSSLTPEVTVSSQIEGLFLISVNGNVKISNLDIISGLAIPGNLGVAFENLGNLEFHDVRVFRNAGLPADQYLIRNAPNSLFTVIGNCFIESN